VLPTNHQLGAGLIVELRGDVKTLGLRERVTRAKLTLGVLVINKRKIAPVTLHPGGVSERPL